MYREFIMNYNYTFNSDGSEVRYNTYSTYEFQPQLSASDPTKTVITTAWNTYITAMSKVKWNQDYLIGTQSGTLAYAFVKTLSGIVYAGAKGQLNTTQCDAIAYGQWASMSGIPTILPPNSSVADSPMLMAAIASVNPVLASAIDFLAKNYKIYPEYGTVPALHMSAATAQALFEGSNIFPCPFVSSYQGTPCSMVLIDLIMTSPQLAPHFFGNGTLSPAQLNATVLYLETFMGGAFQFVVAKESNSTLGTSPVWVTRTVQEILFDYTDPFVALFGVKKNTAYISSVDNADDAWRLDTTYTTVNTG